MVSVNSIECRISLDRNTRNDIILVCARVQLQVENEQLYDELNSMVDEVR